VAPEIKCLRRILNIRQQQRIKNKDIIKRMAISINIVQRMMEKKINFFGHIRTMRKDKLIQAEIF